MIIYPPIQQMSSNYAVQDLLKPGFVYSFKITRPKHLKIIAEHGINIPKISLGQNPLFFQEGVSEKV